MTDQTVEGSSDSPTVISDDGSLNESAFLAALGQSRPTSTDETPLAEKLVEEPAQEEVEEVEEEAEVVAEDETTEEESEEVTEETVEESETGEDVLSQIDWENADWDNFDAESIPKEARIKIADLFGGSVGHAIGELRKKYGEEKRMREAAEAQLREGLDGISNTPTEFKELSSLDDLDNKSTEWRNSLKYANQLLNKTDEYFEINGDDVSRDTLVQWRDYWEGLVDKVPEQRQRLKDLSGYSASEVMKSITTDVPDLSNEESEAYQEWKKIVDDPKMAVIKQIAPRQYAEIQKMAAHSVAYTLKKQVPRSTKIPLKKPKSIGTKSAAAPTSNVRGAPKHIQDSRSRIVSGEYNEKDIEISLFSQGGAFAPKS